MNTFELMDKTREERNELFSHHQCDVTSKMEDNLKVSIEELNKRVLHENISITIIDFHKGRYLFHKSTHIDHIPSPIINQDEPDNWDQLYHFIHPNDRYFCYTSDIMGYKYLMSLSPEDADLYEMDYTYRLKNKSGKYKVYHTRTYMWKCDDKGVPWLAICESRELPECRITDFTPYRQFCLMSEKTKEVIKVFDAQNCNELSEIQVNIVKMRSQEVRIKDVAGKLFRGERTIRNNSYGVNKRLNVTNIPDAKHVAKLLRII